jgi:hypothetical protein
VLFEWVRNEDKILPELQLSIYLGSQTSMMHKTLRHLALLLLLCMVVNSSSFAAPGISVRFIDARLDSVQHVSFGYTITVCAEVRNTDTLQSFSGFLDFGLHNGSSDLTNATVFNKPPYSGRQITLGPGEVVPAIFSIDITDSYFAPGPDVVVVWPISSSPITDSIVIDILIQTPSGIAKTEDNNFSYAISDNRILLFYSQQDINFQQVRILNLLGQQAAYFKSDFISDIPIPNLPKGIYLCEMISADNKTRVFKFLH